MTTLIISIEDRIAKYTRNTIQTMADPDMQKSDAGWAELFFFLAGTYIYISKKHHENKISFIFLQSSRHEKRCQI